MCLVYILQIGGIPNADEKPPGDVLLVCKLNPVTEVSPPSADKAIKNVHGTKISQQIIRVRELITQTDKKLLILDVNGLLGHVVGRSITKRPHYYEFLEFCFERFHVAIWSSRLRSNLDPVLDDLMGDMKKDLLFCWDSSHCTDTGHHTLENSNKPLVLKELRILWNQHEPHLPWRKGVFNETNTLLLDDSPCKSLLNPPHTAIFPFPYTQEKVNDNLLGPMGELRLYLKELHLAGSVKEHVERKRFGQHKRTLFLEILPKSYYWVG
ncbi:hypothetical protein MKW94_029340 [Papaver nudicaule]|uniref:Mitochondrial import inner membrane translocase subunit TIM50 n=1 Tax=Papaver nudicaule TaxID=74823 RepID=A0AA41W2X2_PAPNU|nr:hypothetical protein [Papaver nudicaule]